jgi:murein DD-endopeptidase MepM/ murein hydrolase activator NlpD
MAARVRSVATATVLCIAAASIAAASDPCREAPEPHLVHPTDLAPGAGFGVMRHPLLEVDRLHAGLDYPGPIDTPIRASATGTVEFAAYEGQHGNRVIVRHGAELRTAYSHLRSVGVTLGQCVEAGSIIGKLGSTGLSSGPHLHFEVLTPNGPVDPVRYLPPR